MRSRIVASACLIFALAIVPNVAGAASKAKDAKETVEAAKGAVELGTKVGKGALGAAGKVTKNCMTIGCSKCKARCNADKSNFVRGAGKKHYSCLVACYGK